MRSSVRTPAMAKAAPPTAELASWSARVRPMATGSPVVPEVTCMRTSASTGAQRCSPKGGRAACEARSWALVSSGTSCSDCAPASRSR